MKEKLSKIVQMFGIPKLILVMAAGVVLIALSAGDLFQSSSSKPQGLTGASIENKEEVSSTGNYTTDTEYVSQLEKSLISTLSCVSDVNCYCAVGLCTTDIAEGILTNHSGFCCVW